MAKRGRHTPEQIIRKLAEGNKLLPGRPNSTGGPAAASVQARQTEAHRPRSGRAGGGCVRIRTVANNGGGASDRVGGPAVEIGLGMTGPVPSRVDEADQAGIA